MGPALSTWLIFGTEGRTGHFLSGEDLSLLLIALCGHLEVFSAHIT